VEGGTVKKTSVMIVLAVALVLVLGVAGSALAGKGANPPASVMGSAESYFEAMGQYRTTKVWAKALPRGGVVGLVRMVREVPDYPEANTTIYMDVRDLAVEDGWAYIMGVIYEDTNFPETEGRWAYLAVYDGSAVGEPDQVSTMWADDYPGDPTAGEAQIRAMFDARDTWTVTLMDLIAGGYRVQP
jgi:hypothetical protein